VKAGVVHCMSLSPKRVGMNHVCKPACTVAVQVAPDE
jgi:hypothetical protein